MFCALIQPRYRDFCVRIISVEQHATSVMTDDDAAVIVCDHASVDKYVARRFDQIHKIDFARRSHVVHALHVDRFADVRFLMRWYSPDAYLAILFVLLARQHDRLAVSVHDALTVLFRSRFAR